MQAPSTRLIDADRNTLSPSGLERFVPSSDDNDPPLVPLPDAFGSIDELYPEEVPFVSLHPPRRKSSPVDTHDVNTLSSDLP